MKQDTLYEVILSSGQIDTIHGALIAQEKLYRGLVASCDNPTPELANWLLVNSISKQTLENILTSVQEMLIQLDNFALGTELPEGFQPKERLLFKEAFEPFEEL